jgi:AcrR family transcriptional regulator
VKTGLRERKKLQMRFAIANAAYELFAERGFDAVTVAEVADLAGTSVQTVFNYFPVKEDLVLNGRRLHEEEFLRAITERPNGMPAIEAARLRTLEAAEEFATLDPIWAAKYRAIVFNTPSILARLRALAAATETEIAKVLAADAGALASDPRPRVVATVLMNLSHLAYLPSEFGPDGVRDRIEQSFALLADGLGGYAVRV